MLALIHKTLMYVACRHLVGIMAFLIFKHGTQRIRIASFNNGPVGGCGLAYIAKLYGFDGKQRPNACLKLLNIGFAKVLFKPEKNMMNEHGNKSGIGDRYNGCITGIGFLTLPADADYKIGIILNLPAARF
jgi:hypothetical protein